MFWACAGNGVGIGCCLLSITPSPSALQPILASQPLPPGWGASSNMSPVLFQIAKEDAVLPAALFPSLCELVFHNNPLVAHTRGMVATCLSPNPVFSVSPRTLILDS